jgi:hypothetical protein
VWRVAVEEGAPRGAGGDGRGVIDIRRCPGLSDGHQCISQTERAHVVGFGGLHDLDERLVQTATRSAMSTPSAVSRIRAPARRGSCDRPDAFN